jgi:hypothetical protein
MPPRTTHRSGSGPLAIPGIRTGLPERKDHPSGKMARRASLHSSSAIAWGGLCVIFSTKNPLMRWTRSRPVKMPASTIASY